MPFHPHRSVRKQGGQIEAEGGRIQLLGLRIRGRGLGLLEAILIYVGAKEVRVHQSARWLEAKCLAVFLEGFAELAEALPALSDAGANTASPAAPCSKRCSSTAAFNVMLEQDIARRVAAPSRRLAHHGGRGDNVILELLE